MALDIFYRIKNAYETSTRNTNRFAAALAAIKWEAEFFEDGEYYYIFKDMVFTTPSLDPFNMSWNPSAIFEDGSFIEIK